MDAISLDTMVKTSLALVRPSSRKRLESQRQRRSARAQEEPERPLKLPAGSKKSFLT